MISFLTQYCGCFLVIKNFLFQKNMPLFKVVTNQTEKGSIKRSRMSSVTRIAEISNGSSSYASYYYETESISELYLFNFTLKVQSVVEKLTFL